MNFDKIKLMKRLKDEEFFEGQGAKPKGVMQEEDLSNEDKRKKEF